MWEVGTVDPKVLLWFKMMQRLYGDWGGGVQNQVHHHFCHRLN